MKIKSGIYDVLYSGTVNGIKDEPIEFQFPDSQGALKIIFDFKIDEDKKESTTEFEIPDNKTMVLKIINAQTSLGIGNTKLLSLGHINNRKLYLNHRIYSITGLSKTIHYTFYLGEEVNDDE